MSQEGTTMSTLRDAETNIAIREATAAETSASIERARYDGGAGVIEVDGRRCCVDDEACESTHDEKKIRAAQNALFALQNHYPYESEFFQRVYRLRIELDKIDHEEKRERGIRE